MSGCVRVYVSVRLCVCACAAIHLPKYGRALFHVDRAAF